jgi:hypothetical protein
MVPQWYGPRKRQRPPGPGAACVVGSGPRSSTVGGAAAVLQSPEPVARLVAHAQSASSRLPVALIKCQRCVLPIKYRRTWIGRPVNTCLPLRQVLLPTCKSACPGRGSDRRRHLSRSALRAIPFQVTLAPAARVAAQTPRNACWRCSPLWRRLGWE